MAINRRQAERGHSLIELVVGVLVSGVLAVKGLPQLQMVADKQAVDGACGTFISAIHRARIEALSRGLVVTVCALDRNRDESTPSCSPQGKDWTGGLLVFVDRGERGQLGPEDQVLFVHQAGTAASVVISTLRYVSFQPSGVSLTAASHFDFLPPGSDPTALDAPGAQRLCINKPGRIRALGGGHPCE